MIPFKQEKFAIVTTAVFGGLALIIAGLIILRIYGPAAIVHGQTISQKELNSVLPKYKKFYERDHNKEALKDPRKATLDILIRQKAIRVEATKHNITASTDEIESRYQSIIKNYGNESNYVNTVKILYDWDAELTKKSIEDEILKEKLEPEVLALRSGKAIMIQRQSGLSYTDAQQASYSRQAQGVADRLAADIKAQGFDEVYKNAKGYGKYRAANEDPNIVPANFTYQKATDTIPPEMLNAIFGAKKGDVSGIVLTGRFFLIFRVDDIGKGTFDSWDHFLKPSKIPNALQAIVRSVLGIDIAYAGICSCANCTGAGITGHVYNAANSNIDISGATVTAQGDAVDVCYNGSGARCAGSSGSDTTNSSGIYSMPKQTGTNSVSGGSCFANCQFGGWTVSVSASGYQGQSKSWTPSNGTTSSMNFAMNPWLLLDVSLAGTGYGRAYDTVPGPSAANINCGNVPGTIRTNCSATFIYNTDVTLARTIDAGSGGSYFSGWSGQGGCSLRVLTSTCSLTMVGPTSGSDNVTAYFNRPPTCNASPNPVLVGQTVTFTGDLGDGTNYAWSKTAAPTSTAATQTTPFTTTYASPGTYTVYVGSDKVYNTSSWHTGSCQVTVPVATLSARVAGGPASIVAGVSPAGSAGTCTPNSDPSFTVTTTSPDCTSPSTVNTTLSAPSTSGSYGWDATKGWTLSAGACSDSGHTNASLTCTISVSPGATLIATANYAAYNYSLSKSNSNGCSSSSPADISLVLPSDSGSVGILATLVSGTPSVFSSFSQTQATGVSATDCSGGTVASTMPTGITSSINGYGACSPSSSPGICPNDQFVIDSSAVPGTYYFDVSATSGGVTKTLANNSPTQRIKVVVLAAAAKPFVDTTQGDVHAGGTTLVASGCPAPYDSTSPYSGYRLIGTSGASKSDFVISPSGSTSGFGSAGDRTASAFALTLGKTAAYAPVCRADATQLGASFITNKASSVYVPADPCNIDVSLAAYAGKLVNSSTCSGAVKISGGTVSSQFTVYAPGKRVDIVGDITNKTGPLAKAALPGFGLIAKDILVASNVTKIEGYLYASGVLSTCQDPSPAAVPSPSLTTSTGVTTCGKYSLTVNGIATANLVYLRRTFGNANTDVTKPAELFNYSALLSIATPPAFKDVVAKPRYEGERPPLY